ncbi:MAG: DUF3300 domain-containing protein [Gammaproteobacteria bacterium]|nr:DUF3300 domain-containing protein [Gammaproteobacteria bacterium]
MNPKLIWLLLPLLLVCTTSFGIAEEKPAAEAVAAPESKIFTEDQLKELVAPIALYPDSVVAQVLMAATYPLQIVQAARWQEKNPKLKGEELEKAIKDTDWDPSVKSLLHFADVLKRMNENLDWTQDLGDAMLAQQAEVMAVVQKLRKAAYEAGNLKTTEQQKIVVEQQVIKVQPTTEVIYVPSYSPTVVYGSYWAPTSTAYPIYSYPPSYWYPPSYAGSNLISFGVGMAFGAAIWGDCDWNNGHVGHYGDIDINRNTNINVNQNNFNQWNHNTANRKGVRYADNTTAQKFDQQRTQGGVNNDLARGYDPGQAGNRTGAGNRATTLPANRAGEPATGDRAGTGNRAATQPAKRTGDGSANKAASANRPSTQPTSSKASSSRPTSSSASRPQSSYANSAYSRQNASFDRAASQRGASSRGSTSYGGSRSGGGGRR